MHGALVTVRSLFLASYLAPPLSTSMVLVGSFAGSALRSITFSLVTLSIASVILSVDASTIGKLPIIGDGRPQAKAEGSLSALKLSASKGNKDAQYFLGNAFYYGGVGLANKDESVAFDYFQSAAVQGHLEAQTNLGVMLLNGYGADKEMDARAGLAWLEKSADAGNRDGQWLAGYVYMNGMPHAGIHKDERKAVAFLEKAAEQGSKHGLFYLGVACEYGIGGLPVDYERAAQLYAGGAASDGTLGSLPNLDAKYHLALMLAYGRGVQEDLPRAAILLKQCSDRGHAQCTFYLGKMHFFGKGVPVDYDTALQLFERAASSGDVRVEVEATKATVELQALLRRAADLRAEGIQIQSRGGTYDEDRVGEEPPYILRRKAFLGEL